jgi:hypothetical protein
VVIREARSMVRVVGGRIKAPPWFEFDDNRRYSGGDRFAYLVKGFRCIAELGGTGT